MDSYCADEGSADSVFSGVTALCSHLSSRLGGNEERKGYYLRELRKIAYSYLLKKRTSSLPFIDITEKDVSLELFVRIAQRQSLLGEWTPEHYSKAVTLIERYEAIACNNLQYSWFFVAGKMLLALESHHYHSNLSHPDKSKINGSTITEGLLSIFRLPKSEGANATFVDLDEFSGIMCRTVENHLDRMRNSSSIQWLPDFTKRKSHLPRLTEWRRKKESSLKPPRPRSNSSSPFTDEGFSSPSRQDLLRAPIDWNAISSPSIHPRLEWESVGDYDSFDESIFDNPKKIKRLRKSFQLSPYNVIKVDRTELIVYVKALLTGIPSDIFPLVGGEFAMKPGLYADGIPPIVMFCLCKPLRMGGTLFARMNQKKDDYPCSTSSTMDRIIQQYLLDYHAMILSLPDSLSFSKLALDILPFIDQLKYLSKLLEEVLRSYSSNTEKYSLQGWRLLEKLHDDLLRNGDPNLNKIISGLFLDCCQVYFGIINDWIFEGKWHPDLFFEQTMTAGMVTDRYGWLKMFSFSLDSAPTFIPSKSIFECGKAVHLVRDLFKSDVALFSCQTRPSVLLATSREQLDDVKSACQQYSHFSDEFERAVRRIFINNDDGEELLRVALEKATEHSLKFIESMNAENEQKRARKKANLDLMKDELKRYQHHRNIKILESSLCELLECDRVMFYELQQLVANSCFRSELIERYVKELDQLLRITSLNTWKQKRHALTSSARQTHFDDDTILPKTDGSSKNGSQIERPVTHNVGASEVDAAQSRLSSQFNVTSKEFDLLSTNEEDCIPQGVETSSYPEKEEGSEVFNPFPLIPTHEDTCQKAVTVHPDTIVNIVPTIDPDNDTSSFEQAEDSSTHDVNSSSSELINPPNCCREAAFSNVMTPTVTNNRNMENYASCDSYGRIISDYERRMLDGTFKPFIHIARFKRHKINADVAEEEASGEQIEFGNSFVSYHMKKSISYPLEAQNKVMNNLILHKFFVENECLSHMKRLRDVFFRHNGVCAMIFTKLMSRKIEEHADHPEMFLVHPKLRNILNLSFPADSDFISLKIEINPPRALDLTDPCVFNCLRITYAIDWPIKLILTEKALSKYNDVFQFLFCIDRTLFHVAEASLSLKPFSSMAKEHFTQIHLHLHVMRVILNSIKLYTGFCLTSCWEKFHNLLCSVKCPEHLYRVHVKYLKNILNKLMLAKQMSRVHDGIQKILHYILEYCLMLKRCDWHRFVTDLHYRNGHFKKLNHSLENFRIMVEGTCSFLDYYVRQKGQVHLEMLQQSFDLTRLK